LDAIYFNPIVPTTKSRTTVDHEDRKPGPGMLKRAARDLTLNLGASYMVGDMISDVIAGANAGCRTNLLIQSAGDLDDSEISGDFEYTTVPDLSAAARLILSHVAEEGFTGRESAPR
jgi:D-glycero-D-manno-heptose 1,7-bisphosphate phosphatase